jgi:hypothetical protein
MRKNKRFGLFLNGINLDQLNDLIFVLFLAISESVAYCLNGQRNFIIVINYPLPVIKGIFLIIHVSIRKSQATFSPSQITKPAFKIHRTKM